MYTRRRQAASIAAGMLVVHVCLWCMRLLVDVVIFVVLCRVAEVILEWLCGDTVFFVCFKLNVCVFSRVSYSVYIYIYIVYMVTKLSLSLSCFCVSVCLG